jgi:hypothetical protein
MLFPCNYWARIRINFLSTDEAFLEARLTAFTWKDKLVNLERFIPKHWVNYSYSYCCYALTLHMVRGGSSFSNLLLASLRL